MNFSFKIALAILLIIAGAILQFYVDPHTLTISIKDIPAQELKGVLIP